MTNNNPEEKQPWERQKNEPSKAYASFCIYRDIGPSRSAEKVVSEIDRRSEMESNGCCINISQKNVSTTIS